MASSSSESIRTQSIPSPPFEAIEQDVAVLAVLAGHDVVVLRDPRVVQISFALTGLPNTGQLRQYDGVSNTSTDRISNRPIHMRNTM